MTDLGYLAILLGLGVAAFGIVAAVLGFRASRPELVQSARNAVLALAGLITLASLTLILAFQSHDFSVRFVAENSSWDMPWHYLLTSFWGGQAGSLLFWSWMLSLFSAAFVIRKRNQVRDLMPYAIATLLVIQIFFLFLLTFITNPFERLSFIPADGRGLNPLLLDDGMRIHPPLLLTGYMSFSIPFALAIAALLTGKLGLEWIRASRRWMLLAWTIQGMGLLMGAWWAYHVLGWGGYWGWDPVENAALMPWLAATAFLHSIMVQERRGMLKVWNLGLVIGTFALSVFGTFVVRSGVLVSVHSFALSAIGPYFFGFLGLVLVVSAGLLLYRLPELRTEGHFDALLSREASFLLNNLLLAGAAFVTFWGTIFPLTSEALTGSQITVGAPFFQRVNGPILLALVLLMGVGPLLAWRKSSPRALLGAARWPLAGAAVLLVALATLGLRAVAPALAYAVAVFVLGTVVVEYARGIRARQRSTGESAPRALTRLVGRNRRRYAGYVVHLAVICLALGVIGSTFFQSERETTVAPGQTIAVGRYQVTYQGTREIARPGVRVVAADLDIRAGDRFIGSYQAEKRFYRNWEQQPTTGMVIQTTWPWLEDVYVYMASSNDDGSATFRVFVNPLVSLLWVGAAIFLFGSLLTMWPGTRTHRRAPLPQTREAVASEV